MGKYTVTRDDEAFEVTPFVRWVKKGGKKILTQMLFYMHSDTEPCIWAPLTETGKGSIHTITKAQIAKAKKLRVAAEKKAAKAKKDMDEAFNKTSKKRRKNTRKAAKKVTRKTKKKSRKKR